VGARAGSCNALPAPVGLHPNVGLLMQTPQCLVLLEPNFRPWAHLYQNRGRSATFYTRLECNLEADLMRLRAFTVREDADKYKAMLITVLGLFGKGIKRRRWNIR